MHYNLALSIFSSQMRCHIICLMDIFDSELFWLCKFACRGQLGGGKFQSIFSGQAVLLNFHFQLLRIFVFSPSQSARYPADMSVYCKSGCVESVT